MRINRSKLIKIPRKRVDGKYQTYWVNVTKKKGRIPKVPYDVSDAIRKLQKSGKDNGEFITAPKKGYVRFSKIVRVK